jgi:hypothetical protein
MLSAVSLSFQEMKKWVDQDPNKAVHRKVRLLQHSRKVILQAVGTQSDQQSSQKTSHQK